MLFENAKDKLERAIVVIDESGRELFKYQLVKYLKGKMNAGDKNRIKKVKMQGSKNNNLLQLADMVAGAVNRSLDASKKSKTIFREFIKAREMYMQIWPK